MRKSLPKLQFSFGVLDESGENVAIYQSDQLLQSVVRLSKDIPAKVRNVEESVDQLRAVIGQCVELASSFKRLAERDQQQRSSITQLQARNQSLQMEKNEMAQSLSKAESEKRSVENLLTAAHTEKNNIQVQVNTLIREREVLLRTQADAIEQIANMRSLERNTNSKITELQTEVRDKINLIGELEQQIIDERQEHNLLREQNAREAIKRMEDQRAEFVREFNHKLEVKVQDYEMKLCQMKKTFENALKEAELETKKLAAERNEWFAKYNKLVIEWEEKKRRLNAGMQRLLSEKWQEMMRSFNRQQASENTRDTNLRIRRAENLASKFMEELMGSSASDSSLAAHDQDDAHENVENVPPVSRASRQRSASAGPSGRQPLIQDVVAKVVSSHANPRAFKSNTRQQKQVLPKSAFLSSRNQNK